jgi:uncharacterized protein (TIGR02117 family)
MAMTTSRRRAIRYFLRGLTLLVALPLFYLLAGVLGSIIPSNAGWKQPEQGVTIFLRTNGVHTWILVPKVAEGVDWRPLADPAHIRDHRYGAGDYLAFGFGNRDFYLNTPDWSHLSVPTAFAAAFGRGPGLLHVEHVWSPKVDAYQQPMRVSPAQYRQLASHIRESYRLDASSRPVPLLGRGYGPSDIFYEARGRYDARRTCNEWTGEALRSAGIRTGIWTPFSQSIMWRLD